MHAPCHTHPPAMHAPLATHTPPAMHASVPHIPPPHPPPFCQACPLHRTCPPSLCMPAPFTTHAPLHYVCLPLSPHMPPPLHNACPPLPCLPPPPRPDRMTDACENIIFPQPLLRTVKIEIQFGQHHSIFNCATAENKTGWFISLSKWVYDILTITRFVSLPYPVGNSRIWSKTSFHRINWKIPWPNLNTIDI